MPNHRRNGKKPRREFVKQSVATLGAMGTLGGTAAPADAAQPAATRVVRQEPAARAFNGPYTGEHLRHVAFPLGGIGAGMVCLEGTGALSHVSLRHRPDVYNEPARVRRRVPEGRHPATWPACSKARCRAGSSTSRARRPTAASTGRGACRGSARRASRRASPSAPCACRTTTLPMRSSSPAGARSSPGTPTTRACPWPRSSTASRNRSRQPARGRLLVPRAEFHGAWARRAAAFAPARWLRAAAGGLGGDSPRTKARSRRSSTTPPCAWTTPGSAAAGGTR